MPCHNTLSGVLKEKNTLQSENVKILHRLQLSLAKVSASSTGQLFPLHQILICGTTVFPQLNQFWNSLWEEIVLDNSYIVSIGGMRLRLSKLQKNDNKSKLFRSTADLPKNWKVVEGVLHYQGLLYIPIITHSKVISCHYNDFLAGHFDIDKTKELVGRKYYWPSLKRDVESYVWRCDVCLTSKAVCHKPYGDLHSLPILTHRWKDLSMDFVTSLPLSADWKGNSYDLILVIVNRLTKMVHYKSVKVTINAPELAEVILDVVVWHHGLSDSIVTNRGSLFTSNFRSSLY